MQNEYKEVYFHRYCPLCVYRDLMPPSFRWDPFHFTRGEISTDYEPCHECLENPMALYSHKPVKFKEDERLKKHGYFRTLEKLKPYFFRAEYDELDYSFAKDYYEKSMDISVPTGCSSLRCGNFYGRNLDWVYNRQAEFLIFVPGSSSRFASFAVAGGIGRITDAFATEAPYDDIWRVLPFNLYDGMNEHGLIVSTNVVPLDYGVNISYPKKQRKERLSALMLIRYILDNYKTADEAVIDIRDHIEVHFPSQVHALGYEMHFMIADKSKTYCVEFVDNEAKVMDISARPVMTNFYLYGVDFNGDGSVYTPETQDAVRDAMRTNHVTKYGSGLERYNYLLTRMDISDTEAKMRRSMNGVRYTKTYLTAKDPANPFWYTEYVGGANTCATDISQLSVTAKKYGEFFAKRTRDDLVDTWQTVHSSVYNMENLTLSVITQEDGVEYRFVL